LCANSTAQGPITKLARANDGDDDDDNNNNNNNKVH
jgi:hypothetical protein